MEDHLRRMRTKSMAPTYTFGLGSKASTARSRPQRRDPHPCRGGNLKIPAQTLSIRIRSRFRRESRKGTSA